MQEKAIHLITFSNFDVHTSPLFAQVKLSLQTLLCPVIDLEFCCNLIVHVALDPQGYSQVESQTILTVSMSCHVIAVN